MMEGWLNAWREGGWVPQWSAPGAVGSMTGTMSDVSMSEAIVKLPHCGTSQADSAGYCVNASALYKASRQNAFVVPEKGQVNGRVCLQEYIKLGYIPQGCSDADVSRSMNYWHSDWALSQAASLLGEADDAAVLLARSQNWTRLLDPSTGFFRVKDDKGEFSQPFDQFEWGPNPGYTEAGAWQYRVEVPYDPQGLNTQLKKLGFDGCDIVQKANQMSSAFHLAGYGSEIHEMSEMAINCWGQWELNNQPVWALQHMQIGFDSNTTGKCAGQAQKWLRQSNSMLHPGADMYPGDEDNGSMGAWFVMNLIGIYPLSPASGSYVLGSPAFANVSLSLPSGAHLVVTAQNQAPSNVYVQSLTWNGVPVSGVQLGYQEMMKGGTLMFTMGSAPATV